MPLQSKEQRQDEMIQIYSQYENIFKYCKIERIKFLEWVEGFSSAFDMHRAYKFWIYKVLKELQTINTLWAINTPGQWYRLIELMPRHVDLQKLTDITFTLKELWQNKPKPRRRY